MQLVGPYVSEASIPLLRCLPAMLMWRSAVTRAEPWCNWTSSSSSWSWRSWQTSGPSQIRSLWRPTSRPTTWRRTTWSSLSRTTGWGAQCLSADQTAYVLIFVLLLMSKPKAKPSRALRFVATKPMNFHFHHSLRLIHHFGFLSHVKPSQIRKKVFDLSNYGNK